MEMTRDESNELSSRSANVLDSIIARYDESAALGRELLAAHEQRQEETRAADAGLLDSILASMDGGRGQSLNGGGSWWNAYNSVTEWLTHDERHLNAAHAAEPVFPRSIRGQRHRPCLNPYWRITMCIETATMPAVDTVTAIETAAVPPTIGGTLLPSNVACIASICRKEDNKFALTGVHVKVAPDHASYMIEATDTRMLARVEGLAEDFGSFPAPDLVRSAANGKTEALIPGTTWSKAFTKKRSRHNPILEQTALVIGENESTFAHTDLSTSSVQPVRNQEGRFPPTDTILPTANPTFSCAVDADLLMKLLKVAAQFADGDHSRVTLEFHLAEGQTVVTKAVMLKAQNQTQKFTGLLMPLS